MNTVPMNTRTTKTAINVFVQQLLELIDKGQHITVDEAINWSEEGELYTKLNERFDLKTLEFVNTYDYTVLNKIYGQVVFDHYFGNIENNGLILLANVGQFLANADGYNIFEEVLED